MSKQITAIFEDQAAAARAIERLELEAGIVADDLSIIMSEKSRGREFVLEEHSKAPEGAATGAATGGLLGAAAAALVAVGTIAAPGIGLVAAGPILAGLAGAGAGAATGGVIGALAGLGVPEHEAKVYSDHIDKGSILVAVQAHEDRVDKIEKVLEATGGKHIS